MQTMDAALADLVRGGMITRDLAESRSSTPEELKRLLEGKGGDVTGAGPTSVPMQPTLAVPGGENPRVSIGGPGVVEPPRRGI